MKPLSKNIVLAILTILIVSSIFSSYSFKKDKPEEVNIAKVVEEIQNGSIQSIDIEGTDIRITLKEGKKQTTRKESNVALPELLINYGVTSEQLRQANINVKDRSTRSYILGVILPSLLPLLLLMVVFWFMLRQMQ
ncbi:MAG: ATP-dependent metallopeptidase FtsH/Yme1/Tma family protein, partial [Patescibacteria group bacterium]